MYVFTLVSQIFSSSLCYILYFDYDLFMNCTSMFMKEIVAFLEMEGFPSQQLCHELHSLPVSPFLWSQHPLLCSVVLGL